VLVKNLKWRSMGGERSAWGDETRRIERGKFDRLSAEENYFDEPDNRQTTER